MNGFSCPEKPSVLSRNGLQKRKFSLFKESKGTDFSFPTLCKGKTRDFRYRSIKGFSWVGVEKQSVFAGRRKRIESESQSGILNERQQKAMEKTITKLCLMLAMLHLARMADAMTIESKGR